MKILLPFVALATALVFSVNAQTAPAAASKETNPVTWTAVAAMARDATTKVDKLNMRIDQMASCQSKGMSYAPGTTGADAVGCVQAVIPTNLLVQITAMSNVKNQQTMASACGAQGLIFDGKGCRNAVTAQANCQVQVLGNVFTNENGFPNEPCGGFWNYAGKGGRGNQDRWVCQALKCS